MPRLDFSAPNELRLFFAILLIFGACNLSLAQPPAYSLTVEGSPASTLLNHTVYRFYVNMETAEDELSAVFGNNAQNLILDAPAGVFSSAFNSSWSASGINPAFLSSFPELLDDTYATIGLEGPASTAGLGAGAQDPQISEPEPISPFFMTDGAVLLSATGDLGAAYFVTVGAVNARPQNDDLRVLIMQVTTSGSISGQINYQLFPGGLQSNVVRFSVPFAGAGTFEPTLFVEVVGCMDELACNYDPDANFEPLGVCEYPQDFDPAWCDCDGNVLDECDVCGGPGAIYECGCFDIPEGDCDCSGNAIFEFCADENACNYPPFVDGCANPNNDLCQYLDSIGVCGGTCMADVNANGICDTQEISGCTDEWACNFNPAATLDDGSCESAGDCACYDYDCWICEVLDLAPPGCSDPEACNYDGWSCLSQFCLYPDALGVCGGPCEEDCNNNGICDDEEVQGCTYFDAVNYNAQATDDDGSCQFPDPLEGDGCTYPTALNYDEWAVFDDGSCEFPCVGEVNTNVFDWNGDYNVSIADFLMMLSVFGDTDTDFDGIWDSSDECIDTMACNYDADPTEPCLMIDVLDICGGGCEADADNDGICDNVDNCIGVVDECGVCNGPGPTNVVIEDIVITYDSVFLPLDQVWFTYAVSADTIFGYECDPFGSASCGNPVSYQGYDYQTVQIGEQCWFAENLRYLPSVGTPSENYGVPNATVCGYLGNNLDDAMSQEIYTIYGALYNYSAVTDWQLCPIGFHVPSDNDWKILEAHLGMPADEVESTGDFRGISAGVHLALKAESSLWTYPGNNSTLFSALPGGVTNSNNDICFLNGETLDGNWAMFGSSSLDDAGDMWIRLLSDFDGAGISRFGSYTHPSSDVDGYFSIRCVQDTE